MIHLDNITKQYVDGTGTRKVLDGLSLYVEEGDFIAVTGESGSGKTTLLSILGTQLLADSGKYMLGDIDVAEAKEQLSAIRNKKIGMVFQDSRLLPQFTAMQNILLPVLATEETVPKAAGEKAEELMGMMGISALKDKYVDCLSGGEKTRVAICRALLQEPLLLLADEPTGQLDDENANNIASLFRKVNAELGTTIVMVTHSPMIAKAANKRYNLKKGKLQEID